ncbi:MAG: alpha/beta hydrolase [Tateyamaria sp.]|uniref:alpha/beta hydrolase n=1 Tax=Tateyamaria sp. TaxID=1929288 RepID=UPI0032688548
MKRLKILVLFALCAFLSACGRPPELIGIDNAEVPVASVQAASKHKIFLASTRQASETVGAFYSTERAPELGLASVVVSVPPTHVVGELNRPKRLPPDPRTEFAIIEPTIYQTDNAFVASINRQLAMRPRGSRDILFFVHGYNNTTSDALLRLGQFVEDTNYQGVAVLFDWASAAKLSRYVYDLNSALIARPQINKISNLMSRTNAEGYSVFAHSMGGFLIMEAVKDQVAKGRFNSANRIQNIILASPDIDIDLFKAQLEEIEIGKDFLFVLISEDDSALRTSRRIAGGVPRVGATDANQLADLGVVAIDLSKVDDSASGSHSKFAGSPEVVQLLGRGLNNAGTFKRHARNSLLGEFIAGAPITIAFE